MDSYMIALQQFNTNSTQLIGINMIGGLISRILWMEPILQDNQGSLFGQDLLDLSHTLLQVVNQAQATMLPDY